MNAALIDRLWHLFGYGSATSAGWSFDPDQPSVPGSGYIFAYGYNDGTMAKDQPGVMIRNSSGEKRTLKPASKENVQQALKEMGITETEWKV